MFGLMFLVVIIISINLWPHCQCIGETRDVWIDVFSCNYNFKSHYITHVKKPAHQMPMICNTPATLMYLFQIHSADGATPVAIQMLPENAYSSPN